MARTNTTTPASGSRQVPAVIANREEASRITQAILDFVSRIPASRVGDSDTPKLRANQLANRAAQRAALTAGSLALPPGPIGWLTVMPELVAIWKIQAQVVSDKTLERFDCSHSPSVNHALIAELATCRFVLEQAPVLIAGPTGTGKSHLVQSLCHCALRAGHEVLFISHAKLLAQLHAARATDSFERKRRQLARVDVLAIDDFGLRPMRSPQDEDFHDLIDARYERTTTLLTSNLHFDEWGAAFPNKLMGAATLDRLRDRAYQIILDGETRRKPRPLPEARSPVQATAGRDASKSPSAAR